MDYWEEMIRKFDAGEPIPESARFWVAHRVRNVKGVVYDGNKSRPFVDTEEDADDLKS